MLDVTPNPVKWRHRKTATSHTLVLYAYELAEHMLAYTLARAACKQERWDEHYRYQAAKERD